MNCPVHKGGSLLRDILLLIKKDLTVEARARYAMTAAISFALCAVFMESVSLGGVQSSSKMHSAILWLTIFFATIQIVSHIFIREGEEGTEMILRVRFLPRDIFVSKFICSLVLVIPVAASAAVGYLFFFSVTVKSPAVFSLLMLSGLCAIAGACTLPAMLASRARGKGSLAALLAIPSVLPALIVLVRGTSNTISLTGVTFSDVIFLTAYGLFMAGVSAFLFEFSWKD